MACRGSVTRAALHMPGEVALSSRPSTDRIGAAKATLLIAAPFDRVGSDAGTEPPHPGLRKLQSENQLTIEAQLGNRIVGKSLARSAPSTTCDWSFESDLL